MSMLVDQQLVGEIAEYCPTQFLKYYSCLGKGDAMACIDEQKELATCAKQTAPTFIRIVARCKDQMGAYEDCIRAHPDFRTKCQDKLVDMKNCTNQAIDSK